MWFRISSLLLICCYQASVYADKCPDREQIIARELSKQYEWSVAEDISLQELLAVEQLVAVKIMNQGEFVRCEYRGEKPVLNLDAISTLAGCKLVAGNSLWVSNNESELMCLESEPDDCRFEKICHDDVNFDEDHSAIMEQE